MSKFWRELGTNDQGHSNGIEHGGTPLCLSTPVPVCWHLEVSEGISLLSELLLGLTSGGSGYGA
jgi:hypothetical protein